MSILKLNHPFDQAELLRSAKDQKGEVVTVFLGGKKDDPLTSAWLPYYSDFTVKLNCAQIERLASAIETGRIEASVNKVRSHIHVHVHHVYQYTSLF